MLIRVASVGIFEVQSLRHVRSLNATCSCSPVAVCDITSCRLWVSAVGHLVQGGERREDAALVRLHDVSVLDHLVQDDVHSVQVEHDLRRRRVKETKPQNTNSPAVFTDRKFRQQLSRRSAERIRPVHSVGDKTNSYQAGNWRTRLMQKTSNASGARTHHAAEIFIQNLHEVVNQLVDGQLVLRRQRFSFTDETQTPTNWPESRRWNQMFHNFQTSEKTCRVLTFCFSFKLQTKF